MTEIPADWYDGFFEGAYLDEIALSIPAERTHAEASFVLDRLELEPGARILDLGCGHGRHSLELARRGFRVTGADLSVRSLELAREAAAAEGLEVDFVRCDMRDLDFEHEFDAVVNLFTAFGYFEAEEENQRVLDGVARALRPGGRFLIDTINLLGLVPRYRAHHWEELDGGLFLQAHRFDILGGRNQAVWTFLQADGGRSELRHSIRTYTPHELARMLDRAGLAVVGSWGGFDGSELSMLSHRLILRADRP